MIFPLPRLGPRRKVPEFAIVAIVSEPQLGTYEKYLFIVDNDTTIIGDILVNDRPKKFSNVNNCSKFGKLTYMPISHKIFVATSEAKIFARTSHE